MESPFKGKTGLRRVWNAFHYSCAGLHAAYRHEDAFRQEVLLALVLAYGSSVLAALLFLPGWLVMALAVIMSVLTVISGIQYFYGARSVFQMEETERKI